MRSCSKSFPVRLGLLALLPIFILVSSALAQTTPVSDYLTLSAALDEGVTDVTNFETGHTTNTPIVISFTNGATLSIATNVTINAGTNAVYFAGDGNERFFNVRSKGVLTLNNLAFTGGNATNGGAIYNQGTLILSNCLLTGNSATNANGANGTNGPVDSQGNGGNGSPGGDAYGGAIYSTGSLFIYNSILTNNTAQAGNGGNGGNASGGIGNGGMGTNGGNAFGGAVYSTGSTNVFYLTEIISNYCIAGAGGAGGMFATNTIPREGSGGACGLGGSAYGGGIFISGLLNMTNCLVANNSVAGGGTGAAEVDSDGGGADGSPGGVAFGGGLYITNRPDGVFIEQSIFFFNTCYGGAGGSAGLNDAIGGTGGNAYGGGVWSEAALVQMAFCTLATNRAFAGPAGLDTNSGTNGVAGISEGWELYQTNGAFDLTASILSYDPAGSTNAPNAYGVTDFGYNVISDQSVTKSTLLNTTKLNTDPDLASALSATSTNIGGIFGTAIFTLPVLVTSPAASLVPGVPGVSFPVADLAMDDRSTPTTAGAFELNNIPTNLIVTNAVLPQGTNSPTSVITGVGGSAAFTNTVNTNAYTNPLPFGYQWQLNGTNVTDGPNYMGATSNVLTIKQITFNNQGNYTVLLSPTILEGTTTDGPVTLILTNAPTIKGEPAGLTRPIGAIVTFTVNVVDSSAFEYQWMLNGSNLFTNMSPPFTNNEYILGTNANVLTIDPATYQDEGLYSVIVSNSYNPKTGAKKSSNARLVIVADNTRPTIAISNPPVNNLRSNGFVLNGIASDNAQVTNVYYWLTNLNPGLGSNMVLSGSAVLTTNGNTNFNSGSNKKLWAVTNVTPLPGTNILAVQAVDFSGNLSSVVSRRFFYKVPSLFALSNVDNGGAGTLTGRAFIHNDTPPTNGAMLNIGEGYEIVAAPGHGSLLGTWSNTWTVNSNNVTVTNIYVTNGNTFKFIMESNSVVYASFVSNLFLGELGSYNGLFSMTNQAIAANVVTNTVTNIVDATNAMTNSYAITNTTVTLQTAFDSSGMLDSLVLGAYGTYSGRLLLAGDSYGLSGTFNAFGQATNHIKTLTVTLDVATNGGGILTGSVSNSGWTNSASLWAEVAASAPGLNSNYTLLMLPYTNAQASAVAPPGDGYALLADHAGKVTLGGALADGTSFNESVPASRYGNIPIYESLYDKTGFLFGWINLTNLDTVNAANGLIWIKGVEPHPTPLYPAGFQNILLTEGSLWVNPGAIVLSPSNSLVISNAALDLNYTVAIKGKDQIINASDTPANALHGTVSLATGQLQLSFGNGNGNRTTPARGAMLQDTTNAGGYFVLGTSAGSVFLNGSGGAPGPADTLLQYLQSPLTNQDAQYAEYQFMATNTNAGVPAPTVTLPPPQIVLINGQTPAP